MSRSGGGSPGTMANINLKGKKHKLLACGCCDAVNLKDKLETERVRRELQRDSEGWEYSDEYVDMVRTGYE